MLRILIVDDDKNIRDSFEHFFLENGYNVWTAMNASQALKLVEANQPQIMITDFDLPCMSGVELIKKVKEIDPLVKFILISGKIDTAAIASEVESLGVIEFIPKPVSLRYVKTTTFPKIQVFQFQLEKKMRLQMIAKEFQSLQMALNALESKDKYTEGHSKRVMEYCVEMVEYLPKEIRNQVNVSDLQRAGLLHDLGKIGLSESILNKVERISDEEFEAIKEHPVESVRILAPIMKDMPDAIAAIKHHHEKYDGSGYPSHLQGEDIPLLARIMAVTDAYDAMTSNRAYRKKMPSEKAITEIKRCKNSHFDPVIADAFLDCLAENGDKSPPD